MADTFSGETPEHPLRAAISLTVSYMGTTVFAVTAGLITFFVSMLVKGYREGWPAVRASWIGDVGWGIVVALVIWIGLFLFCLGKASERALARRIKQDDVLPSANRGALRRSVLFLSNEINQFAQERNDTRPTISLLHLNTQTLGQRAELEKGVVAHRHETLRLYYERFGARVSIARDDLAAVNLTDARLDELYAAPAFNEEVSEIAESLRLLAERIAPNGGDSANPDVTLEGTFPGTLALHASGHACEIRTGPLILESTAIGTKNDGAQTRRVMSERYTIEFPIVPDLRDGDKEVIPALLCGEGYSRGSWPEKESKRKGMAEFLRMAEYIRRVEIGEPDVKTCTNAEVNDFAERVRRPLTFSFEITFWNSDHTQQWKRTELLVHEPETATAFVRHTGKAERLLASNGVRL